MKSIRTRILSLTIMAVLVSVLAVGTICFFSLRTESDRASTEAMRLICDERRRTINDYLDKIELSLDIVSQFAVSDLDAGALAAGGVLGVDGWGGHVVQRSDALAQQSALDAYLRGYSAQVESVLLSAANRNDGIITFYYRINPEISMDEKGFLYSRIGGGEFEKIELTDLSLYDPDDDEHVGWYYTPLRRGTASWLDPYDNGNLGIKMISYETPIYKESTFIGVMGVDIDYSTLVDLIRDIRLYKSDYAFLTDKDGAVVYHPTLPSGYLPSEGDASELADIMEQMKRMDSNTEPARYTLGGVERQLFFSTISSGQKLVVTAPVKEINESWTRLGPRLTIVLLVVLLAFVLLAYVTVSHITNPLRQLTLASQSIAEGNYGVQLDYNGDDEVGTLTRAFKRLVNRLKDYINDLNSMAYRDALTGVKNKAAYSISAQKLNDLIRISEKDSMPEFALIMFDCNDLKTINDSFGHDKGDIYLRTACKSICDVFIHSPVFRVGGDEFVALLTDAAYADRESLLRAFNERAAEVNQKAQEPWEFVHIAKGLATYDPKEDPDVEHVLQRADMLMYEDKKRTKEQSK